jgi:pre-mRNA-processing factor 19
MKPIRGILFSFRLNAARRSRQISPSLATADEIAAFQTLGDITDLHSAKNPTVLCIDQHVKESNGLQEVLFLTGGKDGSVHVSSKDSMKNIASSKSHKKSVNSAIFANADTIVTASEDHTIKIFKLEEHKGLKIKGLSTISAHADSVTSVTMHPCRDFFASVGMDSVWSLHDLGSAETITSVSDPAITGGLFGAQFHPDGKLIGCGTVNGVIKLWDVKSQQNVANLSGHNGSIKSLYFSENGYHLATTSGSDSHVKFWDLRKQTNFYSLEIGSGIGNVRFDHSGRYVGVAHENNIS